MEEAVVACLYQTLDSDPSVRQNAEARLMAAGSEPGYGPVLARLSLQANLPFGIRQLAAVVLKQYVKFHWERDGKHFREPQASEEDKAAIRAVLPQGLSDDLPRIRTAVGMAIASIAKWDWPENWPELLPGLVGMLRAKASPNSVHGAVRCLSLFAGDIEERALPELLPVLLPDLLSIISNGNEYGSTVQRRSLRVFYFCVASIGNMELDLAAATRNVILPMLPPWFEQFAALMAHPISSEARRTCSPPLLLPAAASASARAAPWPSHVLPNALLDFQDTSDWGIKMEVLKILVVSIGCFGKHIANLMPAVMAPCWSIFVNSLPLYEANVVSEDGDIDGGDLDSDGENLDFESLISQLFELLLTLIGNSRYNKLMADSVGQLAYHSIAYMQMTRDQALTWARDPNQYVADEEDETFSVRVSGEMLLDELIQQFEGPAISAMAQATQARLQEAEAAKAAGDPSWWRKREATLLAVGNLSETFEMFAEEYPDTDLGFDFSGFLDNVRTQDLSSACDCPFLIGRALWVVARLSEFVPEERLLELTHASVAGLNLANPPPVRIGACRAVARLCPRLQEGHLQAAAQQLYQGLGTLLQDSSEEVLHLVLETLLAVVKADSKMAATWEPTVSDAVFKVWGAYANDPLISIDAYDIIAALSEIPECQRGLVSRLAPPLCSIVSGAAEGGDQGVGQVGAMVEGSLEMLAMLLRKAPAEVACAVHALAMAPVMRLMTSGSDAGQLQSGTEVLRLFFKAGGEAMLSWNGMNAESSLQAILEVIVRLLKPESGESAALNVGGLITQMMASLPGTMPSVLPQLLDAIVTKIAATNNSPVITGLLMVFCRLIHLSPKDILDFLASRPSPEAEGTQGGQPALTFVMSTWFERQNEIRGQLNIKLSYTAMAVLLSSQHPALQTIQVKGRRLDTNGAIRTRSRAKQEAEQWSIVPLAVKLVEVLSDALIEAQEQVANNADVDDFADDEDDEEEGWNDNDFKSFQKGLGLDLFDFLDNKQDDMFDDEDAKADPMYSIDLVAYLSEHLQAMLGGNPLLRDASWQHLTSMQQSALQSVIRA